MSGSEVDEISHDTRRFGQQIAQVWWQIRNVFAAQAANQANYRNLVITQASQLREVIAERDQLLIDLAEVTEERDQLAHELEGARAQLDSYATAEAREETTETAEVVEVMNVPVFEEIPFEDYDDHPHNPRVTEVAQQQAPPRMEEQA
ncbi:hypothetical protein [Nocardia transvalensis]|uniref:hypothetical protein n=1 Tax=Nocardia transvalensis TaxID=37333 RepID=UPI001895D7E0|nr:hypothetical protein [Nocardia transvalensis]MBF6329785.1 hypothetical protein [Nocardia transvalensis]